MKSATILRTVLLLLVAVSLGSWAQRTFFAGAAPKSAALGVLPVHGVAVVNFHGTLRCASCLRIGELTESVVATEFADERAAGAVTFASIDYDLAGNEHYRDDYDLYSSNVVILRRAAGKDVSWTRLDDVWSLDDDELAFRSYVHGAIAEALVSR